MSLNEIYKPGLVIKEGRAIIHLKYKDIKWFKTDGNYSTVVLLNNSTRTSRISIKELLLQLPEKQFTQIHKSYIVNKQHITEIRSSRIFLGEEELPVGRVYQKGIRSFFNTP